MALTSWFGLCFAFPKLLNQERIMQSVHLSLRQPLQYTRPISAKLERRAEVKDDEIFGGRREGVTPVFGGGCREDP